MNTKAYTILEVMVSIIILGALTALAVPRFGTTMELFRSKEGAHILQVIYQAQLSADVDVDEGRISNYNMADLDITVPTLDHFDPPALDHNGAGSPPTVNINATNYPVYAHADRSSGAYTLYIGSDGTILCDTQVVCTMMHYAPW